MPKTENKNTVAIANEKKNTIIVLIAAGITKKLITPITPYLAKFSTPIILSKPK